MIKLLKRSSSIFVVLLVFSFSVQVLASAPKSNFDVNTRLQTIQNKVRRARVLLNSDSAWEALSELRTLSNSAITTLYSVSGNTNYFTSNKAIPQNGNIAKVATQAATVLYWRALAALKVHSRDEAISALARAARLYPKDNNINPVLDNTLRPTLQKILSQGYPQQAAPDVIRALSRESGGAFESQLWDNPNTGKSTFILCSKSTFAAPQDLAKTAPLYRNIPNDKLPVQLQSPYIFYFYTIHPDAYFNGLARLLISVRYTQKSQLDLAAKLGTKMVIAKLLNDQFLGRKSAPLTLWIETVAANWPQTDAENAPWEAAAKLDSSDHDIMIFRADKPRSDAEWMRELLHEYGHIAWPDFNTFAPPLEPNANGILSGTMGTLWLANSGKATKSTFSLTTNNALKALNMWLLQGPHSRLQSETDNNARDYLRGLCVYIDRVYGTKVLSQAMRSLPQGQSNTTSSLIDSFQQIINQQIKTKKTSLYLPAAIADNSLDARSLASEKTVSYSGDVSMWLYIPKHTKALIIPWEGDGKVGVKSTFEGEVITTDHQVKIELEDASGWQKVLLQIDGKVLLQTGILRF